MIRVNKTHLKMQIKSQPNYPFTQRSSITQSKKLNLEQPIMNEKTN